MLSHIQNKTACVGKPIIYSKGADRQMKKCIRIVCIILLCILFAGCDAVGEIWVRYNENIRAYPTSGTYTNEQLALSFSFTSGENTVKYPDGQGK